MVLSLATVSRRRATNHRARVIREIAISNDAAGTCRLADVFNSVLECRRVGPHDETASNQIALTYRLLLANMLQLVKLHVCARLKSHQPVLKALHYRLHWSLERVIRNDQHRRNGLVVVRGDRPLAGTAHVIVHLTSHLLCKDGRLIFTLPELVANCVSQVACPGALLILLVLFDDCAASHPRDCKWIVEHLYLRLLYRSKCRHLLGSITVYFYLTGNRWWIL